MEKLTFKGKEFKGSEGEWKIRDVDDADFNYEIGTSTVDAVALTYRDVGLAKSHANAKLLCNSKNLLKAAIEAHEWVCTSLAFEASRITSDPDKIAEFIQNHPFRIKLETEILKSL